jgi:uncharacterized membrane protein YfcA
MGDLSIATLALLVVIGLLGGIGITAVGPGGVLPTIALFALTDLSPAQVAGTAIVTHIATGILGTAVYARSGQLSDPETRRIAVLLAGTALIGTPLGVIVNASVASRSFGLFLASVALVVAALVWRRDRDTQAADLVHPGSGLVVSVGLAVGAAAGLVGIGGPMLTVPILIVVAVPALEALAAAQVQSIVIASVGTIGYALHGSIDWPLALLIGVPELIGVVLGWRIARALPTRTLEHALIIALVLLAPYLALHGR